MPVKSLLSRAGLYARTLTHLHPLQLAFRPVHVARTAVLRHSPQVASLVAGHVEATGGRALLVHAGSLRPELPGVGVELARARDALNGTVTLVGRSIRLDSTETDSRMASVPRLARYQLAYLGHVRSLAVAARTEGFERATDAARLAVSLIRGFLETVPPGDGDAWDPYPVAMRILNLVVARELLHPVVTPADAEFLENALPKVIGQHARWLTATLELHLLGNHLFTDGVALYVAGCAIRAEQSATWRTIGHGIITRSLAVDVLSDGGHNERSPMYTALYLEQLTLVLAASRALGEPPPAGSIRTAEGLAAQLLAIAHPDGDIPLFGDSAFGEAPTPVDVAAPFTETEESLHSTLLGRFASTPVKAPNTYRSFPETGIVAVREGNEHLVIDAGPLGSFDQPGHAHSDALTFELSHHGRRLITDGGAGHYDADATRAYYRGPWAHSSISVAGQGSDEVWSAFRAGSRGQVGPVLHEETDGLHVLRGSVTSAWGWKQERLLFFVPGVLLAVFDRVTGAADGANAESHIHFGPDVSVELQDGSASINQAGERFRLEKLIGERWSLHRGESQPVRGWTAPYMGVFNPSPEVAIEAATRSTVRGVGYALLLASDAATSAEGGEPCLKWGIHAVRIGLDERGLRWEQLR